MSITAVRLIMRWRNVIPLSQSKCLFIILPADISRKIYTFFMNKYGQGQSFECKLIQIYLYMNSD
jgi:hypothetical protein